MDYQQMEKEVRGKLASGIKFYPAFREVMLENDIRTDWDVHASRIGGGFARRRRANSKKRARGGKDKVFAECLLEMQIRDAELVAAERNDHLCATRRVALLLIFALLVNYSPTHFTP